MNDDDALDAFLLQTVTGIWHATGTCRMGNPNAPLAVRVPDGHVIGVEGLRACDGSVMPAIPRANPNIPITMIAEKMSDAILAASC